MIAVWRNALTALCALLCAWPLALRAQLRCEPPPDPYDATLARLRALGRINRAPQQPFDELPLTVRTIYFAPSDRANRLAAKGAQIRSNMEQTLQFYEDQRRDLGFGSKPLDIERDEEGNVAVRTVIGKKTHDEYDDAGWANSTEPEIVERFALGELDFDTQHSIIVMFVEKDAPDIDGAGGIGGMRGIEGGFAWLPTDGPSFDRFETTAHEVGHALGLAHNFNSPLFIMSYGDVRRDRLSHAHADFLNTSRYFNSFAAPNDSFNSLITALEPTPFSFAAASFSSQLTFRVEDPDGIASVQFLPATGDQHPTIATTKGAAELYWDGADNGGGVAEMAMSVSFLSRPPSIAVQPIEAGGDGINPLWREDGQWMQRHRGNDANVVHRVTVRMIDAGGFITENTFAFPEETTPNRTRVVTGNPISGQYETVEAAIAEAIPGDIIEIHKNGSMPRFWAQTNGVTVRPGAGFSPQVRGITVHGSQGVVIEDLDVIEDQITVQAGAEATFRRVSVNGIVAQGRYAFAVFNSTLTVEDCDATANDAGAWVASDAEATIRDSRFESIRFNVVENNGVLAVDGCVIDGNLGDGIRSRGGELTVANTTVSGGSRSGVVVFSGATATLTDVTLSDNRDVGFLIDGASATLDRVRVESNEDGVWAQNIEASQNVSVRNAVIVGNNTGVVATRGRVELVNVTVANNSQRGIHLTNSSSAEAWNAIIWQNGVLDANVSADSSLSLGRALLAADNGLGDTGLIFGDPLFADPDNGDYSLQAASPAIDAGDADVGSLSETDFDGNPRNVGSSVDLGAYEYQTPQKRATVELVAGLNLTRIPVRDDSISSLSDVMARFGGKADVEFVAALNADGRFRVFSAGMAAGSETDMELGEDDGVIVSMTTDKTVLFTGEAVDFVVPLHSGVNLVGLPNETTASAMASLHPAIRYVVRYDREAGRFLAYPSADGLIREDEAIIVVSSEDVELSASLPTTP